MAKVLRVFDLDDTLLKTDSHIYIKHKDGGESKLTPAEYATYEYEDGDSADFRNFNTLLKSPKLIHKNVTLLKRMIDKPHKKVTILTARLLAYPIRKFFKDEFGMDVDVVALGSNNPKDKSDWIEKHIRDGYTDIAVIDDSLKNVIAFRTLKRKYPHIKFNIVHQKENGKSEIVETTYKDSLDNYISELFRKKLNDTSTL